MQSLVQELGLLLVSFPKHSLLLHALGLEDEKRTNVPKSIATMKSFILLFF